MNLPLVDLACPFKEFLHNLNFYHYGVSAFIAIIFILFFALAILLRRRLILSAILFLLAFLAAGPAFVGGYIVTEDIIRRVDVSDFNVKRLHFVKAFVVTGNIQNNGKIDFHKIYVKVKFVKKDDRWWMEYKDFFSPVREQTFLIDEPLAVRKSTDFKFLADTTGLKNTDSLVIYTVCKAF